VKYFIDTNVIIDLLDNKEEAKEQIKALLAEENSELFINRLVLLETLRTIHFTHSKKFREAEKKLELFMQVDIQPQVYDDAIAFSRFCNTGKHFHLKGRCEAIDFLHFLTAKYYNLTIIANDKDMAILESVYNEFLEKKS